MEVTRMVHDSQGESHFDTRTMNFTLVDFAPPMEPVGVSEVHAATQAVFIRFTPGYVGDWHPAPARQFCTVLAGRFRFQVTDGETREFGPGDVLLMEDTEGRGHTVKVGDEGGYLTMTQLA